MFYDERIERERGRISRNIMIVSIIGAIIYGTLNLSNMLLCLEKPTFRHFLHLGEEAAIILSGIIILAIGTFKYFLPFDERKRSERDIFYSKAITAHLYAVFSVWAFLMPLTLLYPLPSINFYALPYDYGLYLLFFPIVVYCVYSFKKQAIYFNYSIIESEDYYKNVFKNIARFGLRVLVLLAISFSTLCFSVIFTNIRPEKFFSCALSIILTFVFCFAGACVLYLMLSALEKTSYDNEEKLISRATVISFVTSVSLIFAISVIALAASFYINSLLNEDIRTFEMLGITVGELVARVNYVINGIKTLCLLSLTLSLAYLRYEYCRIKESKLLSFSAAAFLCVNAIRGFLLACFQIIIVIATQLVNDNGILLHTLSQIYSNISYIASLLELILIAIMIIALVRDGTIHKANIASVPVFALFACVLIFLMTQTNANEFSHITSALSPLIPIYCSFIVISLGKKQANLP